MSELFQRNLAALSETSPETAAAVGAAGDQGAVGVSRGTKGHIVLEVEGRALDSRRDPVEAADRLASGIDAPDVVVAGFGGGYLTEALVRRGIRVAAVIEPSPHVLAAVMMHRDLAVIFGDVPIIMTTALRDPVALATLRARCATIVPHGPTVAADADLATLVDRWSEIRVATRPPRILVVGPIVGGSLGIARSVEQACAAAGATARIFDATGYADAHLSFERLAVATELRNQFQGELAQLIGRAVVATAERWRPDLVLALAQAPLDQTSTDDLRRLGIPTAFWFVENGRVLSYWRQVASFYDWFYAIQPGRFLDQLRDAGAERPVYLPVACDPTRHHPVALSPEERDRFGAKISFAGSPYLNRRRMFSRLTDLPLRLWGAGWTDTVLQPLVAEGGRPFELDEMIRIFAATRVNINLHSAAHVEGCDPNPDYVNPRTFELAACGAFQLVDWRSPLSGLFASDEMVTFRDVRELRSLLVRFLDDAAGREAVVTRARARALAEHTYVHRMKRVMSDTLPPELAAAAVSGVSRPASLPRMIAQRERASSVLQPDEVLLRAVREIQATGVSR